MSTTTDVDHLTTALREKTFLGSEFLTWLWFVSETRGSGLALPKAKSPLNRALPFEVWVDDRLILDGKSQTMHRSVMRGGDPSRSQEASIALAIGKIVKECRVGVTIDEIGEFFATLGAEDLAPRSLKLPHPDGPAFKAKEGDPDPDALLELRLQQIAVFVAVLDHLFSEFLSERTKADWNDEGLAAVRAWIRKRLRGNKTLLATDDDHPVH